MERQHPTVALCSRFRQFLRLGAGTGLLATCLALQAAQPTPESVRKLLEVTQSAALVEQAFASVEQMVRQGLEQQVGGRKLTDEQRRVLDLAPTRIAAVLKQEMNWDTLEPIYVAIYQEAFDQVEIDALIAFHQSPVGRSYVSKMPQVMTRSMQVMQSQMQSLSPKLKQAMDEVLREAKLQPRS